MTILAFLIFMHISFYLMVVLFMFVGVIVANRPLYGKACKVSVIVSARDEEEYIEECLRAILDQRYNPELIEVIAVNDRSSDRTGAIMKKLASHDDRLRVLEIDSPSNQLTGKQNALMQALKMATGEIILNTDADCLVSPDWVAQMVSRFSQDVGIVMGFTLMRSGDRPFIESLLSLDLMFLLNAAAGAAGIGVPVSCIGNNIAYRPELASELEQKGAIKRSITEDAAMIQNVRRLTEWKAEVAYDSGAVVLTLPVSGIGEFIRQRARWMKGGFETKGWTVLPLIPILVLHLLLFVGIILGFFWTPLLKLSLAALAAKFIADLVLVLPASVRLGRARLLWLLGIYEIFLMVYSTVIAVYIIFARKTKWKGDTY